MHNVWWVNWMGMHVTPVWADAQYNWIVPSNLHNSFPISYSGVRSLWGARFIAVTLPLMMINDRMINYYYDTVAGVRWWWRGPAYKSYIRLLATAAAYMTDDRQWPDTSTWLDMRTTTATDGRKTTMGYISGSSKIITNWNYPILLLLFIVCRFISG